MADPLHKDDFHGVGVRTTAPIGTGCGENGGNRVAYQAPLEDPIRKARMNPERQLSVGGNPRLTRTAAQIGGALGRAVSQARNVPDSARRGLYVVRDRAQQASDHAVDQISSQASSLADTAQQRAREIADKAQQRGRELIDAAEVRGRVLLDKADDVSQQVAKRTTELKEQLDDRTRQLRAAARLRAEEVRLKGLRLLREHPLEVLGGVAAAAFVTGVMLRIVRSQNASRY
jgi:ElaB/YqjD/DUF883 family membrane-anchored ribosome-binding protein